MSDFVDGPRAGRLGSLKPWVYVVRAVRREENTSTGKARASRRLSFALVSLSLISLLVGMLSACYVPVFTQALADAPLARSVTGPMLRKVGLAGERVTSFGDVSTSSGHTVELVGGYADSVRTILFARVSPAARIVPRDAINEFVLSDQFGAAYRITSEIANVRTGDNVLIFEPLRGPASTAGARLHLSFDTLAGAAGPTTKGSWILTGTLAVDPGRDLALPADDTLGPMHISFTQMRATTSALVLHLDLHTGGLDLRRIITDSGKPHAAFTVTLWTEAGVEEPALQATLRSNSGDVQGRWLWLIERTGRYRIEIRYEGVGSISQIVDTH